MGNDLVREARKRARITQAELADRAGTTQSAIARLESGRTAPSFDDVVRLLRAMGMDLDFMLVKHDDSDWGLAWDALQRTPEERIEHHRRASEALFRLRVDGEAMRRADVG